MTERGGSETPRDLGSLLIAQVGALRETGDRWEPWRLVDPDGDAVQGVAAFLADLQAAGRSEATVRSYGMDLLRWFRFLWAVGVAWDRATRVEARDFCRWLQVAGKPTRPHWRRRDEGDSEPPARAAAGGVYSVAVVVHSETVLRGFYDFHRDAGTGASAQSVPVGPFPSWRAGARASQPDGAASA
jgi:hypothetical protein